MALDTEIIRRAQDEDTFIRLQEWVNKSLKWRGAEICFGDPDVEAEVDIPFMAAGYSLAEIIAEIFPWADVSYASAPENHSGEVDVHILAATVNDIGRAFLKLEEFYVNGPAASGEPVGLDADDGMDEEEWNEMMFQRAMERDRG